MPLLGTARSRNAFVRALDEVRAKYQFALVGYVVMPEHVHLLVSEPKHGNPSGVVHSLKLRVSKRMHRKRRRIPGAQRSFVFHASSARFWQSRFYDFNVWSAKKRREKLDYMHGNPVAAAAGDADPKDWVWSSYAFYSGRGTPLLEIDFIP